MKKLLIFSLAAMLVVAFCIPASALENIFGGYWRTRMVGRKDFSGDKSGAQDVWMVNTRTRLYYTAVLNDNLRFVNKFEFDAHWGKGGNSTTNANGGAQAADETGLPASNGGLNTYGDFGADAKDVEIKNSYVDFNIAPLRVQMGIFGHTLSRGFIWDDDSAGVNLRFKNDMMTLDFRWFKGFEGYVGDKQNKFDVDVLAFNPFFTVAETWNINPVVVWLYSKNARKAIAAGNASINGLPAGGKKTSIYYLGANVDGTLGPAEVWFSGIYQGGSVKDVPGQGTVDYSAYLVAGGGSVPLGPASIHTQAFYASGDKKVNDKQKAFQGIGGTGAGQSYYWSEIMGYGIFDWDFSAGSPNEKISNIWAANLGASIKPFDKLTLTADLWYASLVEKDAFGERKLGTEVDLKATYQLVEGMNLDLVGAYLFAGNATSSNGDNKKDPYEIGSRFSISF